MPECGRELGCGIGDAEETAIGALDRVQNLPGWVGLVRVRGDVGVVDRHVQDAKSHRVDVVNPFLERLAIVVLEREWRNKRGYLPEGWVTRGRRERWGDVGHHGGSGEVLLCVVAVGNLEFVLVRVTAWPSLALGYSRWF